MSSDRTKLCEDLTNDINIDNFSLLDIIVNLDEGEKTVIFLCKLKLLKNEMICDKCGKNMVWRKQERMVDKFQVKNN